MAVSAMRLTGILPVRRAGGAGQGWPCKGPARCRRHEKQRFSYRLQDVLRRNHRLAKPLFQRVRDFGPIVSASEMLRSGCVVDVGGTWGSATALLAAGVARKAGRPILLVAQHLDDADALADDIEVLVPDASVHLLPAWETQLAVDHVSEEVTGERLGLLNLLSDPAAADERVEFLVAPVLALLQPVPSPEVLAEGRLAVRRGLELPPDDLAGWLIDAGYERVEQVDRPGEFAVRGGIVDLFCPDHRGPLRMEYFGDDLESLRHVDLDTQRSVEEVEAADITAMTFDRAVASGTGGTTHFLDYLPADSIICLPRPAEIATLARQLYERIGDDLAAGDDETSPVALRDVAEVFGSAGGEIASPRGGAIDRFARLDLHLFAARQAGALHAGVRSLERLHVGADEALAELEELSAERDVRVYCGNAAERDRFAATLAEHFPDLARRAELPIGSVSAGFDWPDLGATVVGHGEILQHPGRKRRVRRVHASRPVTSVLDLREGEYVVHVGHGIAKYEGLRGMERDGAREEFLRLRFADNAVLSVPTSQVHLVQKYVGAKGKRPTLSKLGGKQWANTRQRVSEAVEDLAAELLRIQAMRETRPGFAYPTGTDMQRQLAESFPFTETPDQIEALAQIDADLARARPMDRLVCGDVGYGKTELAIRAALKVVEAGRQVAVLVPTTVLADQHRRTFGQRLADFPVRVGRLSRFRTPAQQQRVLADLAAGSLDVLIGTHRMLSADVRFADLGLIVIDEEQRFGVADKETLKGLRAEVDVLTLSATPIPRTLHLALLGLRDISSLQSPPMDRRAIHTEVCPDDDEIVRSALLRELNRGGQTFFVHNRVQDIHLVKKRIRSLVPDARVAVGHGQLPERALEDVMLRFLHRDVDVLVCTTIIESGLDIPTANTMIVHEADRHGLADLHQLRGRVGRYKHRAYCYLLLPGRRQVNPLAAKRLKAIEDFSDLGAGFQIAMRDLEIRGAGNILGPQQSGHIASVGYELYCQLLDNSVRRFRGEPPPTRREVHIDLGVDAYIPRRYMPSERQRLDIYRRLASCDDLDQLVRLRADLRDAFGPPPEAVGVLLDLTELRVRCLAAGIESVVLMPPDVIFTVADASKAQAALGDAPGSVRAADPKTLHWRPPRETLQMPDLLQSLPGLLRNRQ
jgi:transcription-repair coupling factor (superfamily II helicase)